MTRRPALPLLALPLLVLLLVTACSSTEPTAAPPSPAAPRPSTSGSSAPAPSGPQVLATGLEVPWGLAFLPDGDALITERESARVLRLPAAGGEPVEVTELSATEPDGEGGLLGIAVSPDFATDGMVYAYLTADDDNRVVRFPLEAPEQVEPVLTGIPKGTIHNGGRIAFGPDGLLYVGTGDTGDTSLAQDPRSLGGKVLRMTRDGEPAEAAGSLVFSRGHRNVQGLAFGPDGALYATEFGQNRFDEVNRLVEGGNGGWPEVEGDEPGEGFLTPLTTWQTVGGVAERGGGRRRRAVRRGAARRAAVAGAAGRPGRARAAVPGRVRPAARRRRRPRRLAVGADEQPRRPRRPRRRRRPGAATRGAVAALPGLIGDHGRVTPRRRPEPLVSSHVVTGKYAELRAEATAQEAHRTPATNPVLWFCRLVREVVNKADRDRLLGLAAESAFFAVLTLFPALLVVAAVLGQLGTLIGATNALRVEQAVLDFLDQLLTDTAGGAISTVEELFSTGSNALTVAGVLALASLSTAFSTLVNTVNIAYDVPETRGWWRRRWLGLLLGFGSVLTGAIAVTLLVIGPIFGRAEGVVSSIGVGPEYEFLWSYLRWPIAFTGLVLWATTMDHLMPNRRTRWRYDLPGGLLTALLWLAASYGLNLYLELVVTSSPIFGALGGGLILMTWFYLLCVALLSGAELNAILLARRRMRAEQALCEEPPIEQAPGALAPPTGPAGLPAERVPASPR